MPAAALRKTPSTGEISVAAGTLVRMRLPASKGKRGRIVETSLTEVGHALARGAIIIDAQGNPILARRLPVRRRPHDKKIEYGIAVFNSGPECGVCFDPSAPPHLAMVYKA